MSGILEKIIETKRQEIMQAKSKKPYAVLLREAEASGRIAVSFKSALLHSDTGIIAEFKRKSPSKGFIKEDAKVENIVPQYVSSGATAISVLTDRNYFAGSPDDLIAARRLVSLPILRKDFMVDPYQICEAKLYGADAVLLIASALSRDQCRELSAFAHQVGLEVLLEIHDASELSCLHETVDVVGVNNRNLDNFVTDVRTSFRLAAQIPPEFARISESGISSPETVKSLRQAGFIGFLMGENFMKQPDPADALKQFIRSI
ncbi:MAG: indole-3-glycerol phosphate synthase TrpC [Bacteroidales bacterium]|jgi:indole-3-glycerol phosphate synthase|nr:indole-3-glycerol phosphate synthase TrpC [Bacteroidales bacterium]